MSRPIYLYRVEWDDVRPSKTVRKEPIIAGGMHDAREARGFVQRALMGSPWSRLKGVRGMPVVRRVRRIGPDTPETRDRIGAGL